MKSLLLTTLSIVAISTSAFADNSRHTANYFRGLAPEYIDKRVSLDVSAVHPMHRADSEKFGFLVAQTFDTRSKSDGGRIFVVADKDELLDLVKRFGSKPEIDKNRRGAVMDVETLRLTGVLRETENKVLFLDIAETDVPATVLADLKKEMGKDMLAPKGPNLKKKGPKAKK